MTIQKRMRWRDYAEAYPCEECGNPPTKDQWRVHNAWIDEHAAWHGTASEEELRKHAEDCAFSARLMDSLMGGILDELRPLDLVRPFMRVALHAKEPSP